MHAVARNGPFEGLALALLAPLGHCRAAAAGVGVWEWLLGSLAVFFVPLPDGSGKADPSGEPSGNVACLQFRSSWCRCLPAHLDVLRHRSFLDRFRKSGANAPPPAAPRAHGRGPGAPPVVEAPAPDVSGGWLAKRADKQEVQ